MNFIQRIFFRTKTNETESLMKDTRNTKNTRKVESMTTPNTFYEIDMEKNSCSCPSYQFSSLVDKDFQCKHLLSIPCH